MLKLGFFAVLILGVALAQEQKSCRAVFSEQNRKQIQQINVCVKQLGYKTGREKTQKSACVQKCVLENLEMLNDEGYVDQKQYNTYLAAQWPEYWVERANATFQPCLKIKRDEAAGPNDEFCKAISPITKCLTRNFANLCRGI